MTNSKPYTEIRYSIYDKTLYLQRLLYAVDTATRGIDDDSVASIRHTLMEQANKEVDNAIASVQDILELIGYFPQVRDIDNDKVRIWKQPTRYTANKKESAA